MQEAREASMQTMELLSLLGETLTPHNGEKCWKKSAQAWSQKTVGFTSKLFPRGGCVGVSERQFEQLVPKRV